MNNFVLRSMATVGIGMAVLSTFEYLRGPAPKVAAAPAVTQVTLTYDQFVSKFAVNACKFLEEGDTPTRAGVRARRSLAPLNKQDQERAASDQDAFVIDLEVALWDTCPEIAEQVAAQ